MRLGRAEFLEVVARTPLVSIDVIVRRKDGAVLLGMRTNEPARGCWFVPGGRIHKNETIEAAFRRICADELGLETTLAGAKFLGVFEHFYSTNFAEQPGFGTHYVVLAYEITPRELPEKLPADQHGEFRWFDVENLLRTEAVHAHTRAYFEVQTEGGWADKERVNEDRD
jgi:colanic acid biosynthesis protein WcaH